MSSIESEYLMSMENTEQYKGKWIAILDTEIIAEGQNLSEVYKEAIEKSKGRTPLFEHIPEKQDEQTLIL
jgi:hypothetical protein